MPFKQSIFYRFQDAIGAVRMDNECRFPISEYFSPILESAVFWHTENLSEILVLGAKSVFTGFHRVSEGFHRVSEGFIGFHRVSEIFKSGVFLVFARVLWSLNVRCG